MNPQPDVLLQHATDAELLMRFVKAKDESCFETIVARHSNLVYRVCQTVLFNPADAEDAFQATFVVLVRKAGRLIHINSLPAWLYKVAYRISLRANHSIRKRNHTSLQSDPEAEVDQFHMISRKEILSGVFDELSRLPSKYKDVLVECYLQGKTYREVADATDTTETIVKGRVAQAKKTLRRRLLKRGIALSFVLTMLESIRSVSVAGTQVPAASLSVSTLMSDSTTKISSTVQFLSQLGIKRMSMQLLTKPLSLVVFAFAATVIPVFWMMSTQVIGQDSGLTLQESKADPVPNASLKVPAADPFGTRQPQEKSSKKTPPKAQGKSDPFQDSGSVDPFGSDESPATGSGLDPFGGSPRVKSNPKSSSKARKSSRFATGEAAELKINESLTRPADFDFVDTPVIDVAEALSEYYDIAVHVDKIALEDAGFDLDTPLTGVGKNRTLRSALTFLFKSVEFAFVVKNETLIITTYEAITNNPERYVVSKIYDVTDIGSDDVDSLIATVQQSVDEQSWNDAGGYGAMNVISIGDQVVLAVSHTSEHHNQINNLIENLRKVSPKKN